MRLRIATFNIENLIARHQFGAAYRPDAAAALSLFDTGSQSVREAVERSLAAVLEDDKRQATALAIAETDADILCLQEVDSLAVMEAFFANYVHRVAAKRYGHFRLVEGNDRRGIDVGFACRRTLVGEANAIRVQTNRDASFAALGVYNAEIAALGILDSAKVFHRDCLEVEIDLPGGPLVVFLCHLKSMNNGRADGREATHAVRSAEARAVRALVERRFGTRWREALWVIAGDLNDYAHVISEGRRTPIGPVGITPLTEDFAVSAIELLPETERWTHFRRYWSEARGALVEDYMALDYLLMSPALARRRPKVEIIRRGLPYRVPLDPYAGPKSIAELATTGDRYPRIGWDRPKASDHCPLVVEIDWPTA